MTEDDINNLIMENMRTYKDDFVYGTGQAGLDRYLQYMESNGHNRSFAMSFVEEKNGLYIIHTLPLWT